MTSGSPCVQRMDSLEGGFRSDKTGFLSGAARSLDDRGQGVSVRADPRTERSIR